MVYQMPCPGSKGIFVASSEPNPDRAQQELQGWAAGNGYRLADAARAITIYGRDQQRRQWVLLEQAGVSRQSSVSARSNTGR